MNIKKKYNLQHIIKSLQNKRSKKIIYDGGGRLKKKLLGVVAKKLIKTEQGQKFKEKVDDKLKKHVPFLKKGVELFNKHAPDPLKKYVEKKNPLLSAILIDSKKDKNKDKNKDKKDDNLDTKLLKIKDELNKTDEKIKYFNEILKDENDRDYNIDIDSKLKEIDDKPVDKPVDKPPDDTQPDTLPDDTQQVDKPVNKSGGDIYNDNNDLAKESEKSAKLFVNEIKDFMSIFGGAGQEKKAVETEKAVEEVKEVKAEKAVETAVETAVAEKKEEAKDKANDDKDKAKEEKLKEDKEKNIKETKELIEKLEIQKNIKDLLEKIDDVIKRTDEKDKNKELKTIENEKKGIIKNYKKVLEKIKKIFPSGNKKSLSERFGFSKKNKDKKEGNENGDKEKKTGFFSNLLSKSKDKKDKKEDKSSSGNSNLVNYAKPEPAVIEMQKPSVNIKDSRIIYFDKMVMAPGNALIGIAILLIFLIFLAVVSISILNIVIYIALYIYESIKLTFNEDIINHDTLYYNILKYINVTKKGTEEGDAEDISQEPYFFIFVGQYTVYINLQILVAILFIVFLIVILYLALSLLSGMMDPPYKFEGSLKDFKITFGIVGLLMAIFVVLHIITYKYYFADIIYKNIATLKSKHNEIDKYIFDVLKTGNLNEDYCKLLNDRNRDLKRINDHFKTIDSSGNGTYTDDVSIKVNILLYVLYSYLHDVIPTSNKEATELINDFFTAKDSNVDSKRDNGFLTFISLLRFDKTMIIKKYYTDLGIYNDKDKNIDTIIADIDEIINKLNDYIINNSEIRAPFIYLGSYFLTMLIMNIICILIIGYFIATNKDNAFPEIIINILYQVYNTILWIVNYLYNNFFKSRSS